MSSLPQNEHYHVVNMWCGVIGGDDYGYLRTRGLAERAILAQQRAGYKGGCRHSGSGWAIQACFANDCARYTPQSRREALPG
jgi:hypothetical protein